MNIKKPIFEKLKTFKINGIKKKNNYSFNSVISAIFLTNIMVYLLAQQNEKIIHNPIPKPGMVFIKIPLTLMVPFEKDSHVSLIHKNKITLQNVILIEEIKKDENNDQGLYLIELNKELTSIIPSLRGEEIIAIPPMQGMKNNHLNKGVRGENTNEINF